MRVKLRRPDVRPVLTVEERDRLAKRIRQDGPTLFEQIACRYCGGLHVEKCPRVRRVVFQAGTDRPVEVEFWPAGGWPEERVIYADQIYLPSEEASE